MKPLYIFAILAVSLFSCGKGNNESTHVSNESMQKITQHGIEDAEKVIATPDSSMEREAQLLEIKATAERIKQAGNDDAARAYLDAAESKLKAAGIIE